MCRLVQPTDDVHSEHLEHIHPTAQMRDRLFRRFKVLRDSRGGRWLPFLVAGLAQAPAAGAVCVVLQYGVGVGSRVGDVLVIVLLVGGGSRG